MTYTTQLDQLDKRSILLAGGKGANLGELIRANIPVPTGFVLSTRAYDRFVEVHSLKPQIVDLAGKVSPGDPQSGEKAAEKIGQLFLANEIPNDIAAELTAAWKGLGETAVAVRSSATAEDLPQASFAGQQDTFLNIQDEEALLSAIKKCWASLWTSRAMAYRKQQGIDHSSVSLAVVVQLLAPADAAGILFTANPIDGDRDRMVINASWGLGEAIVGGQVTPDTFVVDKTKRQIVSREIKSKKIMTVRSNGGTELQPIQESRQNQAALDETAVLELADLATQIETHYQMPMDIEWAVADNKIAILQARPITNLLPPPLKDIRWDPPRPGTIWMRRQVVEHMPEPLSPLFDELYLQNGLDHSLEEIADFLTSISGMEINMWDFIDPPFAATVNGYAYSIAGFDFDWRLVPIILRMYVGILPKMMAHLIPRWQDESLPDYLTKIDHWNSLDLSTATDEKLLQGIRALATEDAIYWFAAAVPLGMARVTDALFDRFLKSISNGQRLTSGAFLRGFPSKTAEAQAQLEAIARKIDDIDGLQEQVLNTPAAQLTDLLAAHPSVMGDFQQYLETYGHQIYNLDFVAPTLVDDPLPVLLSLQTAVAHPQRDARRQQARLAQERETLVVQTRGLLNPIQRRIFNLLLSWAQRFVPYREEALFYVGAAWPTLRRLALALGQRLTEAGSLETATDVFFLYGSELAEASAARAEGVSRPDLAELARERRHLREARKRLDPPVSVPPDGRMKFGPIDMAMFEPKSRTVSDGPILGGFAVSPGQVTAPASIIRSPEEFGKMQADTILVCTTTTPAWTPLFAQARGLVTDIGGALAHGSIVAREYGIPAVMGTGVATQRIKNGQMITVDGNRGTVTLVDEAEALAKEAAPSMPMTAQKARNARRPKVLLALAAGLLIWLAVWWKRRSRG